MEIKADWHRALEAARRGELGPARLARAHDPAGHLPDLFWARCLTEAGLDLDEAVAILRPLGPALAPNPLVPQLLALALARSGRPADAREAGDIWRKAGLPHNLELLAQVTLTLEGQIRPWPDPRPPHLPWPAILGDRAVFVPLQEPPDSDILTHPLVTKKPGLLARRRLQRAMDAMEDLLIGDHPREAYEQALEPLAQGLENAELHIVAAIAADELGDPPLARAHLVRALELEPTLLVARTHLARVWWREGWTESAMVLWRSLPVEGPYDHGRHYHLALGHDALGDRAAALHAMQVALTDFFFDMRHYYISHALRRWLARFAPAS